MKRFVRRLLVGVSLAVGALFLLVLLIRANPGLRGWIEGQYAASLTSKFVRRLDGPERERLLAHLRQKGFAPDAYVVRQFADHDVVFLGEAHYQRQDPLFVASILQTVYEAGVTNFGIEFASVADQRRIDSLLALPAYDRALAKSVLRTNCEGWWPYEEYLGLFEAAWRVNAGRPAGAHPFRMLGLTPYVDYERLYYGSDAERDDERRRAVGAWDTTMARTVFDEVLVRGEKCLVYCGIHHAFTRYRQPVLERKAFIRFGDLRAGNYLIGWRPGCAVTVYLHAPWFDYDDPRLLYLPFEGAIDQVFRAHGEPVGFDLIGTPFGELRAPGTIYSSGYPDFRASYLYDGYIVLTDLSEMRGVKVIDDWVATDEEARALARKARPGGRAARVTTRAEFLDAAARPANIARTYRGAVLCLDGLTR